jgi:hypothetical protein
VTWSRYAPGAKPGEDADPAVEAALAARCERQLRAVWLLTNLLACGPLGRLIRASAGVLPGFSPTSSSNSPSSPSSAAAAAAVASPTTAAALL